MRREGSARARENAQLRRYEQLSNDECKGKRSTLETKCDRRAYQLSNGMSEGERECVCVISIRLGRRRVPSGRELGKTVSPKGKEAGGYLGTKRCPRCD